MNISSIVDFGNYSCHSKNSLGVASASVSVSGEPLPSQVTSKPLGSFPDSYRLEWKVFSMFRILESRILFKVTKVRKLMFAIC